MFARATSCAILEWITGLCGHHVLRRAVTYVSCSLAIGHVAITVIDFTTDNMLRAM